MNRIDLIRDGVAPVDLKREGRRAIWKALVRTAASAQQKGWTEEQWITEVDSKRSNLGRQAAVKRGREVPAREHRKTLANAWQAAAEWLATAEPAWNAEQIRARLKELRDALADPEVLLSDIDRDILDHAVTVALSIGTNRPALPRWRIVEDLKRRGLRWTDREVRNALERMHESGLLRCEVRGSRGPVGSRRANCYRLPDPASLDRIPMPLARHVGRSAEPAEAYRQSESVVLGEATEAYRQSEPETVEVTVKASPAALAELLRSVAGRQDVEVTSPTGDSAENVVPLRGRHAS